MLLSTDQLSEYELDNIHWYIMSLPHFAKVPQKHRWVLYELRNVGETIKMDWLFKHIIKGHSKNWSKKRKVIERRFGFATRNPDTIYSYNLFPLCQIYSKGNCKSKEASLVSLYLGIKATVMTQWGRTIAKKYYCVNDKHNWAQAHITDFKTKVDKLKKQVKMAQEDTDKAYDKVVETFEELKLERSRSVDASLAKD